MCEKELTCTKCQRRMKRYDKVLRIVRTKNRKTSKIEIERFRCPECGEIQRKAYNSLDGLGSRSSDLAMLVAANTMSDPTAKCAIARTFYADRMNLLKKAAEETDPVLSSYILNAVIEGWSYDVLKARLDIPCCKDAYYDLYRRFFWILSKERG